jgi:hypothetical protein
MTPPSNLYTPQRTKNALNFLGTKQLLIIRDCLESSTSDVPEDQKNDVKTLAELARQLLNEREAGQDSVFTQEKTQPRRSLNSQSFYIVPKVDAIVIGCSLLSAISTLVFGIAMHIYQVPGAHRAFVLCLMFFALTYFLVQFFKSVRG